MATKKTTSKAKTNTRKTTARSTTTRAAATRGRATTRAKAPARTSGRTSRTAARTTAIRTSVQKLLELHRMSAGVFILLAVLAGYFIKNTTVNLTLGYMTKDDLASRATTVFAPAVHGIYDLNLRWAVVVIMALSAILPLLWSFRWRRQYEVNIDAEAMPQRWIDMAVTSALVVEMIALLSGVHDVFTLKIVGGLMVLTAGLGWLADRENRQADKSRWSAYVFGLVAGLLPWLLIASYAVATYVYGIVRAPWYVYALYASTLVGCAIFAKLQREQYRQPAQWKFEAVERNYILTNLFIKAAFAIILIVGLHK